MKKIILSLLAISTIATSVSAFAQFAKPEDAVKYRRATFVVIGTHFGRMAAMAQGKAPFDARLATENAEIVATLAQLPWAGFGPGTEIADTKAKSEVWQHPVKFKEATEKMQIETLKLLAATKTGKEDAFKTAFSATASTCKACHDDFKNK